VIGEGAQQGLLGEDFSVTNALLVITTFIVFDIGLGLAKQRLPWLERAVEGTPVVVFADGQPLQDRMDRVRINESDILEAAREKQGLERLDQVKFAVLERSGGISIIPR
ncbi:MAG TPA: YetF domain-containing protein, partial [Acidimicrobiales bacterium]|nr:YetF domain-containing protein [Acidimicrobiales bacterium]